MSSAARARVSPFPVRAVGQSSSAKRMTTFGYTSAASPPSSVARAWRCSGHRTPRRERQGAQPPFPQPLAQSGPLHDRRLPPQASPLLGQHAQLPLGRPPRSAGWLGLGLGQQAGLQYHEPGRRPWVWGPLDGARRLWHARRPHHGPLPIRDGPAQLPVGAALQAGDMAAPNLSRRLVATAPPHAATPLARSCWHRSSCHNTWPAP